MSGADARAATSSREIGVKAEQVDTSMGFVTVRPLRFRGNDEREPYARYRGDFARRLSRERLPRAMRIRTR